MDGAAQRGLHALPFSQPLQQPRQIAHAIGSADVFHGSKALSVSDGGFSRAVALKFTFQLVERHLPAGSIQSGQPWPKSPGAHALLQFGNTFIEPARRAAMSDLRDKRMREFMTQYAGHLRRNGFHSGNGDADLAVIQS